MRVILRSVMAEHEDDYLEFVMEGDTVEMMETPWVKRLDDKVRVGVRWTPSSINVAESEPHDTLSPPADFLISDALQEYPRIHCGHHARRL